MDFCSVKTRPANPVVVLLLFQSYNFNCMLGDNLYTFRQQSTVQIVLSSWMNEWMNVVKAKRGSFIQVSSQPQTWGWPLGQLMGGQKQPGWGGRNALKCSACPLSTFDCISASGWPDTAVGWCEQCSSEIWLNKHRRALPTASIGALEAQSLMPLY